MYLLRSSGLIVGTKVRVIKIIDDGVVGEDDKEEKRLNLFVGRIGFVVSVDEGPGIGQSKLDPLYIVKFDRVKCRTQVIDCFWIEELEVL
jgi:hypothetical protein